MEKNDMCLIIDVSKPMMEKFEIPKCTYALRLDWGFTEEDIVNLSNELFCNIEFDNVGRRILDPRITGIEKIIE